MEPTAPGDSPEIVATLGDASAQAPTVAEILKRVAGLNRTVSAAGRAYETPYAQVQKTETTKGYGIGAGLIQRDTTEHSNVLPSNDDVHTIFTMAGALFPPFDPEFLVVLL